MVSVPALTIDDSQFTIHPRMSFIDFILNIAGILLWLNWRSVHADPFMRGRPATLSGTLRRAEPVRIKRWYFLAALAALLFLRGIFYQQIGPAVNWTARLDLYFVALTFHQAFFVPAQLFSLLSFARDFLIFYFWLLSLAVINGDGNSSDPIQKMISSQLGRFARWPRVAQMLVPVFIVAVLWIALHPVLVQTGVTGRVHSNLNLAGQSLLVGAALFLSLKYLLPVFLALHLIASYVYLGRSPVWDFIAMTARNLLSPLDRFSLRAGKIDLAPLIGIALILLALHALPNGLLIFLDRHNLTIWPR
jgi:uncharacterized protein YggT (Ycf19 family)